MYRAHNTTAKTQKKLPAMMALTWLCALGDALATLQWEPLHQHATTLCRCTKTCRLTRAACTSELTDTRRTCKQQGQTAGPDGSTALACKQLRFGMPSRSTMCRDNGRDGSVQAAWFAVGCSYELPVSSRGQGECSQQYAVWGRGEEAGGVGSYMHLREPV